MSGQIGHANQKLMNRLRTGQATEEDWKQLDLLLSSSGGSKSSFDSGHSRSETLRAATRISETLDLNKIAQTAVAILLKELCADVCAIFRPDIPVFACKTHNDLLTTAESQFQTWNNSDNIEIALQSQIRRAYLILQANEDDLSTDQLQLLNSQHIQTLLIYPLSLHRRANGWVVLEYHQKGSCPPKAQIELVREFIRNISHSLENARIYQETLSRVNELEAIHRANLKLTSSLNLEEVLNAILRNTHILIKDLQDSHIFLYQNGILHFGAARWANGRVGQVWSTPRPDGITYTVAKTGTPIMVTDISDHPLFVNAPADWHGAIVCMPLQIGETVVGVITIANETPRIFSDAEMWTLKMIGDQAAIAIENARLHQVISGQALTDSLTNLPNRRSFDQHLEDEVQQAKTLEQSFILVIMDLNGFKMVNDTLGHPAGDRILQQVAICLRQNLRDTDFLARYGGDEFCLILPQTTLATAESLLNRLNKALENYRTGFPEHWIRPLSACVGIAIFPKDGTNATDLVREADLRLYENKRKR